MKIKQSDGFTVLLHQTNDFEGGIVNDYEDNLNQPTGEFLWLDNFCLNREEIEQVVAVLQYWLAHKAFPCSVEAAMDWNGELKALQEEIADAHSKLTELGIGKEHWSLPGRIELLAAKACANALEFPEAVKQVAKIYYPEGQPFTVILDDSDGVQVEILQKLLEILALADYKFSVEVK